MGWRDAILDTLDQTKHARYRPSYAAELLEADISTALLSMPPADRIALARELLAGTGRVDVPEEPTDGMLKAAHLALYRWREAQGDPQQDPTNPQKHAIRYRAMIATREGNA